MKKIIVVSALAVVFVLGFLGVGLVQADLRDGLVAYYPFNGNANDESGNENHGTVYGAILTTDRFGNADRAYSFDGVNDYIEKKTPGDELNIRKQNWTISTWVKSSDHTFEENEAIVSRYECGWSDCAGNGAAFYQLSVSEEKLATFKVRSDIMPTGDNAYSMKRNSEYEISLNTWINLIGVLDRDTTSLKIYINGLLAGEYQPTDEEILSDINDAGSPLEIGRYFVDPAFSRSDWKTSQYWEGAIDDIRIYNRALSESEIQELYLEGENEEDKTEYDEGYEAGRQSCIADPESCGLRPGKADFTGELAEDIQSYLTLTEDSIPFNLSPGSYVQAYGSNGMNTLNLEEYARLQCRNFIGENEINIEEASSKFTVYRSGATVYLNSTSGTRIEIPATEISQTLRFADGSLELAIITGNVMLGSQVVDETETEIESAVDSSDTSESIF